MSVLFEVSKPFSLKLKVYKNDAVFRVMWLWFGICFFKISFKELLIRERIGKYVCDGKVYVFEKDQFKHFNPRKVN